MKELTEPEMLHRMAAYCSAAERCIDDVHKKVTEAGLDQAAAERITARLINEKFLDESRFCRSFVNDKLRFNKWGRIKIGYELQRRHIPAALRAEALSHIDEEEYEAILYELLKAKKKSVKSKDRRDLYYKLLRFAAGRGFESQVAGQCLKRLMPTDYADDLD